MVSEDRIAIVDGRRTPFAKAGTLFKDLPPQEMGRIAVQGLLRATDLDPALVDEVIFGVIGQPADAPNVSRVIAMSAGIPPSATAYSVQRNCASGIQSISNGYEAIKLGLADVIIAGGVESMSRFPLLFPEEFRAWFGRYVRAKTRSARLRLLLEFRPRMLKPVSSLRVGLTDPWTGLSMGATADGMARADGISREAQDEFAFRSHKLAVAAQEAGRFAQEIVPVSLGDGRVVDRDNGPRPHQTMEALARLKPVFVPHGGTVTAGNASPLTDGAAVVLMMRERRARELGYEPLGYIRSYAYAGLDPWDMGLLGPAYATPLALRRAGLTLTDMDLIELNEAFAAVVLCNEKAFRSKRFARDKLGLDEPIGEINRDILNVNGGAIAIGHPLGASGTRLVITLLKEMRRRGLRYGLVTMCVHGALGGAMILERDA